MLFLLSAIALSAGLTIQAEASGSRSRVYLFKPATTILIFALAAGSPSRSDDWRRYLVLAGLLFSLAGDVFLMLPSDKFIQGLASFLIAHLLYIGAFRTPLAGMPSVLRAIPFLLYAAGMFWTLLPALGKLRGPVAIYALALCAMAWQAAERYCATGALGAGLTLAGAVLFVLSDSLLAWNRFRAPFAGAKGAVLATYFLAQTLIAAGLYS